MHQRPFTQLVRAARRRQANRRVWLLWTPAGWRVL